MMFLKSWRECTDLLTWRKPLSCLSFCCLSMCFSWYFHLQQFYSCLLCSSGFLQSYLRVQDYRQNVSSFPEVVAICLLGMTSNHHLLLLAWKRQRRNQAHPSLVWTSYHRLDTCDWGGRRDGSHGFLLHHGCYPSTALVKQHDMEHVLWQYFFTRTNSHPRSQNPWLSAKLTTSQRPSLQRPWGWKLRFQVKAFVVMLCGS